MEIDEKELKAAGAEPLPEGRCGVRIHGWEIESRKRFILNSIDLQEWELKFQTTHIPEMVFGESSLVLLNVNSGIKIHFNAFDALTGWKQEALPPVEVPAAEKWKFRSKPVQQVILDYDYTFTTPYCGSETVERISEVVLYEDELADNGVSLLTVKVLRVDGILMRLRDTRIYCSFGDRTSPIIIRERCWREATFQALSMKGFSSDSVAYCDPNLISQRLPIIMHKTEKLKVLGNLGSSGSVYEHFPQLTLTAAHCQGGHITIEK